MNLKRSISILMCCVAVMGMLSVNALTAKAARCTHSCYQVALNIYKEEYHDAYYHYIISGTQYTCTTCNYTYWEDLTVTKAHHTWAVKREELNGKDAEIVYCTRCHFVP